jgi:hypothetical protein
MAKQGRLEARLTLSANQTGTVTDSGGGPAAWTVAAGNYYPLELVAALQAAVIAATGAIGNNFTATISDGEGGTGRVTLNNTATPWSLAFTTTALRDAIGFSANISNVSAAQTGTHARGLWLPGNPAKFSMYGDGAGGTIETDLRTLVGPTGYVTTLMGNKRRVHKNIGWTGVPNTRALAHFESVANESFESFFLDVATGRVSSYIPVGPYIRHVWDADVDGTYAVGRLLWPDTFDLEQYVRGWVGKFNVSCPPLVVES